MMMMRTGTVVLLVAALAVSAVSATWYEGARLSSKRSDHGCNLVSGKVYVMGGCSSDQVYEDNYSACSTFSNRMDVYDIATNTWKELADMPRERYRFASAAVNNKIYVMGGIAGDAPEEPIGDIDVYDIATNKWSTLAVKLEDPVSDLAAFVSGDNIVIAGGYVIKGADFTASARTHLFNPQTNTFTYNITTLNKPRGDLCIAYEGTTVLSFGGYHHDDFCLPLGVTEQFYTNPYRWVMRASDPFHDPEEARGDLACAMRSGKMHIFGGERKFTAYGQTCQSEAQNDAESYDPSSDTWAALESEMGLTEPLFRFCAVSHDNKFFVIGGQGALVRVNNRNAHHILDKVHIFDPERSASSRSLASVALSAAIAIAAVAFAY